MRYEMFTRVALAENLPKENLRRGDVAVVVEFYEGRPDQEPGYELEVFNAIGDTIAVVTVRESQIEQLRSNSVLSMRSLDVAA